jgi:hypothetical protein
LANVAGGIQVLAGCLLAESCHGADGISTTCWKRCRTHLGHNHELVVVKQRLDIEHKEENAFAQT